MNKPDKSSIFKTSLLVALLGASLGAHAAGLGKLTVYSAIGQPLNAEVALSATAEELGGLSARLASHEAFRDAGIEFTPALTGLRLNVVKSTAGQSVLRLTTDAPLNEPFLHFLVELNWTAGRMVREYTFLLDPPEMLQVAKPAAVVAPSAPAASALEPAARISRPVAAAATPRVIASASPRDTGEVRVRAGDTLSKIARENKPETVSLDQMLVALFNGNRDAFVGDNMNRLRAGKILRLPDEATVARVEQDEARRMIVSQAADFNAYRRRLAEAAAAVPVPTGEPRQSATGKIKPQIEQKPQPAPITDKLEVSRTESAKQSGGVDKGRLEEELIARDKALREASERIVQLEKNLESLKRLAELKSQAGAQAQQQAQAAATPAADLPAEKRPEVPASAAKVAAQEVQDAPPVTSSSSLKPSDATSKPIPAPAPKPAAKPVSPPPPPEPDFVAENPELVFGGGGLVALLLGYLGYNAWRRKRRPAAQETPHAETPGFLAETPAVPQQASSTSTVVTSPELADDVSILGDFSQGALTTEESADPVAEADVLMAYGRDGQAEEILLEGLKSDPSRSAIHVKLLELYANRKDVAKFESVANDLHALSRGQGGEWERAGVLARDLGVTGALFTAVAQAAELMPVAEPIADNVGEEDRVEVVELPVAPAESDIAASPAPVEDETAASLDFDLDLGTTSMPAAVAAAEAARIQPADEAMSLDFDFDLGTPSVPESPPSVAETELAALPLESDQLSESVVAADSNAIDFSLDLGDVAGEQAAPVGEVPIPEVPAVDAGNNEVDFDLGLDLDAGPDGESVVEDVASGAASRMEEEARSAMAHDLEVAATDIAGLDFDLGTGDTAASTEAGLPVAGESMIEDLGLSEISLDLDVPEAVVPEQAVAGAVEPGLVLPDIEVPAAEESGIALPELDLDLDVDIPAQGEGDSVVPPEVDLALDAVPEQPAVLEIDAVDDDPEVATKLELAQAYEEMGDREGARELLNEVLNEGSPAQQSLARARLDQLST